MSADTTPATAFDPTRYLTKVSGRDYLEVKWRLVWLRDTYPNAVIMTTLHQVDSQHAIFAAEVVIPNGGRATGWGMETHDDFGDYLEKAETKALGRALAALGFGTQFCADHDFGAAQQRVVDAPVDIRSGRGTPAGRNEATPRQVKYLYAVAREVGLSNDELLERAHDGFGVDDLTQLSRRDISTLIEQLQSGRPIGGSAT